MFVSFLTTFLLIQSVPMSAKPAHNKTTTKITRPHRTAVHPATTTSKKASGRIVSGVVNKKHTAPVQLAKVRPVDRVVEPLKPDKRKIQPVQDTRLPVVVFPPIGIYNIHQREFVSIRVYEETGHLRPKALEEFNRITRCLHTGVQLPMDYRLLTELYQAWLYFGMPSVTLFSGCRQVPYASKGSRHNFGLAVDFNFDGVPRRDVISYFLNRREQVHHGLGVGYYPKSFHVHIDVREKHAFWVDLQPGGEKGSQIVADSMRWFQEENTRSRRSNTTLPRTEENRTQETVSMTIAVPENVEEHRKNQSE